MKQARSYHPIEAEAFEALHTVMNDFPGRPAAAIQALNTVRLYRTRLAEVRPLGPIDWDTLQDIVRSQKYRAWLDDYRLVCAGMAEWNAYRIINNPGAAMPAKHATEVLLAVTQNRMADAAKMVREEQRNAELGLAREVALKHHQGLVLEESVRIGQEEEDKIFAARRARKALRTDADDESEALPPAGSSEPGGGTGPASGSSG